MKKREYKISLIESWKERHLFEVLITRVQRKYSLFPIYHHINDVIHTTMYSYVCMYYVQTLCKLERCWFFRCLVHYYWILLEPQIFAVYEVQRPNSSDDIVFQSITFLTLVNYVNYFWRTKIYCCKCIIYLCHYD